MTLGTVGSTRLRLWLFGPAGQGTGHARCFGKHNRSAMMRHPPDRLAAKGGTKSDRPALTFIIASQRRLEATPERGLGSSTASSSSPPLRRRPASRLAPCILFPPSTIINLRPLQVRKALVPSCRNAHPRLSARQASAIRDDSHRTCLSHLCGSSGRSLLKATIGSCRSGGTCV